MPTDNTPDGPWEALVADLRACRDEQQKWGDIDEVSIARYLAGEGTPEENLQVERAMLEHPELRRCVETVGDVLQETERKAIPTRIIRLLSRRSVPNWVAAACLLVALGLTVLSLRGNDQRVTMLEGELKDSKATIRFLEGSDKGQELQLAGYRARIEAFEESDSEQESQLAGYKARIEAFEESDKERESKLAGYKARIERLEESDKERESKLAGYKAQIERLEESGKERESKLADYEARIRTLQDTWNPQRSRVAATTPRNDIGLPWSVCRPAYGQNPKLSNPVASEVGGREIRNLYVPSTAICRPAPNSDSSAWRPSTRAEQ